jgi:hypothetical protein
MAVQQLNNGLVVRNAPPRRAPEPIVEDSPTNLYGDPAPRENIDVSELANLIAGKLGPTVSGKPASVEVDIPRAIAIGGIDNSAIQSEERKGKVNNKLAQLKALRRS